MPPVVGYNWEACVGQGVGAQHCAAWKVQLWGAGEAQCCEHQGQICTMQRQSMAFICWEACINY